jgi:hypothetical protein
MAEGGVSAWDIPKRVRSSGIRLDELRYNSCRYIISPDFALSTRYCGQEKTRGSYCKSHGALCYLPPKLKKPLVDSGPANR